MDVLFEYRNGRLWIPFRINGEDARGIFDTGSDGTVVDADFAMRLGLRAQEGPKGSTVAGEVQLQKAGPVEFELAEHRLPAEEVNILPLASQLPGLQAILGFDVLRQTSFTVDYASRRLLMDALPTGRPLPFIADGDIRPTTWLETLGDRFEAHIDTGSAQGVSLPLAWIQANAPRLLREETQREILGDAVSVRRFVLDRVQLGTMDLEGIPGEAVSAEGGSFADQQRRWANIGNGVLEQFRLGIDGRKRITILESAK